jgi:hypothetical protein
MAFADSVEEAKAFLRKHYEDKDLEKYLFHISPVKIYNMPKGCVEMAPMSTVWLPKNRKAKTNL